MVADGRGRVLTGTMREDGTGSHHLYGAEMVGHAAEATSARTLASGLKTSNGLAFSPDGRELYHADTAARRVLAYHYDEATGEVGKPRTAIRTAWPDGLAVDDQGRLWVGHWFGAKVTAWNPTNGTLLHTVDVPAGHVTACAFGGPAMSDLYITTARTGLDARILADHPGTGGLFRIPTNVRGLSQGRARVAALATEL